MCRFGNDATPARWVSSTLVRCSTPAHVPSRVPVAVSLNAVDFEGGGGSSSAFFEFKDPMQVLSVAPASGPLDGAGVPVAVHVAHVTNTSSLACRFGSHPGGVSWVNSSFLLCQAPVVTSPGAVRVSITRDGRVYTTDRVYYW